LMKPLLASIMKMPLRAWACSLSMTMMQAGMPRWMRFAGRAMMPLMMPRWMRFLRMTASTKSVRAGP
jgi:hypothetical protein